uniref:EF-hand domain-containing protein n=1 Tax=Euplotes harpa TaxID=151035 RepID=A0A7S3N8D9_9SPIT|mmetsp:Transcript_23010/g.26388  ORF Transcript_23010/g.26388 Transcript_23010/m.26388 type:complete len:101 (+) Transcript_23010:47-349(+)|eukprot:CAMPEP_0168341372 /NCGR_PEP_ID=MMETSP0213-20121227/14643_1 /TAXON_ID=151035 /ORGANISM="Euplotes harpa, Strain FSP1.4" /LENGTH=100 /DNA_ID=CAMNT_0008347833 /DNA_START=45 /DNA_END=347 /DNA_ORIENTATION=+
MADQIQEILDDENKLKEVTTEAFNAVDTDGSGSLDKSEVGKCLQELASIISDPEHPLPEPTQDDIDQAFSKLDTSGDGKISVDEFSIFVKILLTAIKEAL